MTDKKLSFVEWVLEGAREAFGKEPEQLKPYIIGLDPEGSPTTKLQCLMAHEAMKDMVEMAHESVKDTVEMALITAARVGARELCFVSETFCVRYPREWTRDEAERDTMEWKAAHGGSLSGHPKAEEFLVVNHFQPAGDTLYRAEIAEGRQLGEFVKEEQKGEAFGRFANIFRKAREAEGN